MTPQSPFKVFYNLTQGYAQNANNYSEGHHGGLDMVPRDQSDTPYPADIYPIFNGSTISIQDTDPIRGKGLKEKVICDAPFVKYLKTKNVVPQDYTGEVRLEILYWHVLDVLDHDGTLTQDTPIARCGNTGRVYSQGQPVPDSEKGKPPYRGLHLHLETVLKGNKTFNLDKDIRGRIDPFIILNYKPTMNQTKIVVGKDGKTLFKATPIATDFENFKKQLGVEGIELPNPIPPASSL